jgi:hypothetical protein
MILEIGLVIFIIADVVGFYVIWNLNKKTELLETWIENFINTIEKVNNDLKRTDYRGSFEADDEVGTIFKEIKTIISQLDQFKGEEQ